ncbi:DUF3043 domain-containing protein [Ruania halotolerans]|uniref:DUF3043 domain-containing protein n=1 Tax=Ruania halotolerans TaxID=2897773 RepID=UPI001E3C0070|nr:DUF3043 domain-containing protein [Ruania halotolerans]UFU04842.1 DUF3043 domain-containing protein [Ruania halotolerans]
MFGRKKIEDAAPAAEEDVPAGKGRPTPRRRDAEARNKRPLVPTDRRAARREQRAKYAEARERMNQAMVTGDDQHMPAQHRGPVRRYLRDFVDARWNLGEMFLPIAALIVLIMLSASFLPIPPDVVLIAFYSLYIVVFIALADAIILAVRLRKRARVKFGTDRVGRGVLMYVVMRAFQLRRTRLPKPQVTRGSFPS